LRFFAVSNTTANLSFQTVVKREHSQEAPIKPLSISILSFVLFTFPFIIIMYVYSFQGYAFGQPFDTQEEAERTFHILDLYFQLFDGAATENIRCWAWADSLARWGWEWILG
jgi:hypothetical protein